MCVCFCVCECVCVCVGGRAGDYTEAKVCQKTAEAESTEVGKVLPVMLRSFTLH